MMLAGLWNLFEKKLFSRNSTPNLFNQYNDSTNEDLPDGATIRRENLRHYLSSFEQKPDILLVGEAPGFRGCRFSGIPFTDEYCLVNEGYPFKGRQSSAESRPRTETTARTFWSVMSKSKPHFFIWNAIPIHPHPENNLQENRTPNVDEFCRFSPMLSEVYEALGPELVVAIGRKAQGALTKIGVKSFYVRHPAHGGKKAFSLGIKEFVQKKSSYNKYEITMAGRLAML